jgi:hypothetical protein
MSSQFFPPQGPFAFGYFTGDRFIFVGQGGNKNLEINLNAQTTPLIAGDAFINITPGGGLAISPPTNGNLGLAQYGGAGVAFVKPVVNYNNISTVGEGVAPIYGLDNRRGLTAADGAATTLYTTTAAGQAYRVMARIFCTAGTSPSATYTLKWIEGGITVTKTVTVSAVGSDATFDELIQPDNSIAITVQLTAISGTGATVDVAASVEELK